MTIDWWTLGLQTLNVLILVVVLQRFLFKPVMRLIALRREETERVFTEAAATKEEAETAGRDLRARQAALVAQSEQILEESHVRARKAYEETLESGRDEAEELLDAERRRIEDERRDALLELRDRAVDLSMALAGRLLGELDAEVVSDAFIAAIGKNLDEMSAGDLDDLRRQTAQGGKLRVVTAAPLTRAAERHWRTRLRDRLGDDTKIEFAVDESLIAGAELHFQNAVLRFNWRDKLADARKTLTEREDGEPGADTRTGT